MAVRILIADDHGVLRAGLRALLDGVEDVEVVGEASDGTEALEKAEDLRPDLVLMDISMPGIGGVEATRQLKQRLPETRVLILTVHEDSMLLREAIGAGASGYVVKHAREADLLAGIRAVARGELYVGPTMTRLLVSEQPTADPRPTADPAALSRRECDVLRLIARGYTNSQAADELGISVRTVEVYRVRLTRKLGIRNRAELVQWATAAGVLD